MKIDFPKWAWGTIAVMAVILIGIIGMLTGNELHLTIFYFAPVALAAWFIGEWASMSVAFLSAIVWFVADKISGHMHPSHFHAVWNTIMLSACLVVIGWCILRMRQLLENERKLVDDLRRATSEVKILKSFLSICSQCKKIRNEEGQWQQLESYISEHSNTLLSHGLCPECASKLYPEYFQDKEE